MRRSFKLTFLGLILFTTTLYGCNQKEVGNISVITPQTPVSSVSSIDFQGNNQNMIYEDALASYNDKVAGGNNNNLYATYNMNGISIGGPNTESKFPHHVVIRNCKIHDFQGGGLNTIQTNAIDGRYAECLFPQRY